MTPVTTGESVQVWLTTTSNNVLAKRLSAEPGKAFGPESGTATVIDINDATTYQTIDGFGGALTDSSAWLIYNSPQRTAILNDLFSVSGGAGFNLVRLPMGASDFARNNYTYDDTCCDLNDFSVGHDTAYIIPLLQQARQLNPEVKILAVPWSAPGWMKFNNSLTGGGYLRNDLYGLYANYFVRFAQAYNGYGLPIHAFSIQNEPHNANGTYPTMQMEASDQSNFAAHNLRPALNNAGFGSVKILAWDHNWYDYGGPAGFPYEVMSHNNSQARAAVAGVAYHCYESPEGSYSVQNDFHNAYPDKEIHFTECTGGQWATSQAGNLEWELQNNVIGPLRNWARSSLYWNIALDPNNGPYVGGCTDCRGMLTVNNGTGTYTKNEDYYSWAHLAKVVRAGAVRIASTSQANGGIQTVAFKNPDGSLALIALNSHDTSTLTFKVRWAEQSFDYALPPRSVASFKWGGTYRLVNKATGRCVDIAGPSTADGANLQQWTSFGGNNQQFKPVSLGGGWYRFEARHSGKVLDVANCWSSGDGARLQQWTWANNDCQQFRLEPM